MMGWFARRLGIGARLSNREAAELSPQIAGMANSSLPLEAGLRACADELGGRVSLALWRLADELADGKSLDEALEAQHGLWPPHVRALLVTSVRSGKFNAVLDAFVRLQQSQSDLWRSIWLNLAYPLLLVGMLLAVFVFLEGYIAVGFKRVFSDFGTQLPALTQLVMDLSGTRAWWFAGSVLAAFATAVAVLMIPGWRGGPRLLYAIPVLGPIWRWHRQSRFVRLMAILLDAELPLPEALRLTADNLDADLAAACREAAGDVAAGLPLGESLASKRQFAPSMIPLLQWGQERSALPEAFLAAAEVFDGRTQAQTAFLQTVALPVIFILIYAFAGFCILAFFLPLVSIIQKLS